MPLFSSDYLSLADKQQDKGDKNGKTNKKPRDLLIRVTQFSDKSFIRPI